MLKNDTVPVVKLRWITWGLSIILLGAELSLFSSAVSIWESTLKAD